MFPGFHVLLPHTSAPMFSSAYHGSALLASAWQRIGLGCCQRCCSCGAGRLGAWAGGKRHGGHRPAHTSLSTTGGVGCWQGAGQGSRQRAVGAGPRCQLFRSTGVLLVGVIVSRCATSPRFHCAARSPPSSGPNGAGSPPCSKVSGARSVLAWAYPSGRLATVLRCLPAAGCRNRSRLSITVYDLVARAPGGAWAPGVVSARPEHDRVQSALRVVGLADFGRRIIGTLSGGQLHACIVCAANDA